MFQSSPALSSGRYSTDLDRSDYGWEFQSSPALSSGRYWEGRNDNHGGCYVSILARPFERALPWVALSSMVISWFQSSPALSSGRYRHSMRATLSLPCFNPRPPFRAGATAQIIWDWQVEGRFNPRPPFRAGATALPRQGLKTPSSALVSANLLLTVRD